METCQLMYHASVDSNTAKYQMLDNCLTSEKPVSLRYGSVEVGVKLFHAPSLTSWRNSSRSH